MAIYQTVNSFNGKPNKLTTHLTGHLAILEHWVASLHSSQCQIHRGNYHTCQKLFYLIWPALELLSAKFRIHFYRRLCSSWCSSWCGIYVIRWILVKFIGKRCLIHMATVSKSTKNIGIGWKLTLLANFWH